MPVLPEYITLEEASRRYWIDRETLTQMMESGKIRAVKIDGRVAVNTTDLVIVSAQLAQDQDGDRLVSLSEAARLLGVDRPSVANWVRYGWLSVKAVGSRKAKLVSLKQASKLAEIHKQRGYHRGSRLIPRKQEHLILLCEE